MRGRISNIGSSPTSHLWKGTHSYPLHAGEKILKAMGKCTTSLFISISESKLSAWINIRDVLLLWLSLVSIRYMAKHGHVIVGKRGAQPFQRLLVPLRGKGLLLANCQVAGWAE